MKLRLLLALLVLLVTASAQAGEFTAPNGQLGAGLSTDAPEKVRLYGEGTFYLRSGTLGGGGIEVRRSEWAIPLMLGGGYRILPQLELEARLPIAIARVGVDVEDCGVPDCTQAAGSLTPGNLFLGANYLLEMDQFLFKVGGGIAFGPWSFDVNNDRSLALVYSAFTNLEEIYMFAPETVALVAPLRGEYRILPSLALTADTTFSLYIPASGGDAEFYAHLAPGAGYLMGPWILGGRLPLFWGITDDNEAQFALEPFARYDFGNMFASTRFTLNLDDPLGFSFESNDGFGGSKFWAWHFALGGTL